GYSCDGRGPMNTLAMLTSTVAGTVDVPDIDVSTSYCRWYFAWAVLPEIFRSFFYVTSLLTVVGTLIASVLSFALAILIRVLPLPLACIITWIANFIRMTPIVVQLLVLFYGFVWMEPMTIALLVYGIHYSTYMSEVYRAGIDSVPTGQWEATTALSMPATRV